MRGKKLDNKNGKYDKPMWHLLPFKQIEDVVRVLTFGANKYGEDDWKYFVLKNDNEKRYLSACLRHISAWQNGEKFDDETKSKHLVNAICCLLFVLWKDDYVRKDK